MYHQLKAENTHLIDQLKLTQEKKRVPVLINTLKMSSKVLLALATFTFLATNCLGYPGGFLDGLPGGIATRQKCPPKPPTIKEFNATEVGNVSFILITKKESDSELIFLRERDGYRLQ